MATRRQITIIIQRQLPFLAKCILIPLCCRAEQAVGPARQLPPLDDTDLRPRMASGGDAHQAHQGRARRGKVISFPTTFYANKHSILFIYVLLDHYYKLSSVSYARGEERVLGRRGQTVFC